MSVQSKSRKDINSRDKQEKRKLRLVLIIIAIILIIIVSVCAIVVNYIIPHNNFKKGITSYTINNHIETKGISIDEIQSTFEKLDEYSLLDTIDISKAVDLKIDLSKLYDLTFKEYMNTSNIDCNIETIIDYTKLKNILINYNKDKPESINASYEIKDNKYCLIKQKVGKKIDIEKLISDIKETGFSNKKLKKYIIKPSVTNKQIKQVINEANKYLDWYINYENGETYKIPIQSLTINEDNTISIDESFIDDIMKSLESYYDKVGQPIDFKTNDGSQITVSGGTWGTLMKSLDERQFIQEQFKTLQSVDNREPVMIQNYKEIGDTYIEISIDKQHLWLYQNGVLTKESDIVTGDILKNRGTPTGIYFISERIPGKYLKGDNYKTWVNKWMRLTNQGVGLHDAGWQPYFGRSRYKGGGSHGCINLPKQFAYELYDITYVGEPVIIY